MRFDDLIFRGGQIGGKAATGAVELRFPGTATWSGGRFDQAKVDNSGTIRIVANTDFSNASLTNSGTVNWEQGTITYNSITDLNNTGIIDIKGNVTFTARAGSFINHGTIQKTAGIDTTSIRGVFENRGFVNIFAGTFMLSRTNRTTGAYTVAIDGTLLFADPDGFGFVSTVSDGSINGLGTLRLDDSAEVVLQGTSAVQIDRFSIANTSNLTVRVNAVFEFNHGIWQDDSGIFGPGRIKSNSTFVVTPVAGKVIGNVIIENHGTLTFQGATIDYSAGTAPKFENYGSIAIIGSTLQGGVNATFENKAAQARITFENSNVRANFESPIGILIFQGANTNRGQIDSASTIELFGTVSLQEGFFRQRAGGELIVQATASTTYGKIELSTNDVSLNGALTISLWPEFDPMATYSFDILTFAPNMGQYGAFGQIPVGWQLNYMATQVRANLN